ncbi:sodium/glutamate symporter [Phaeobacter gallaeciensis]|uniref:Sodium/glutamate symporter n=1 Tax=Phaeobacter gallaeciensis TaxID=60890 RepID=A0AAC9ZAZ1_9RHOB|nr:sodium/glutamate symporter [Phaeobacter gallaeciensis]AHD10587.1 sodium--glutamate symport carrier (gltS) [Phaeobacter gallaeciensis DSM 26640]ATE93850.1 sodium--glutamate symport carrier (gltS) [Phaeobacter gallaeciensis]ATE96329.1 sodium--glutamate symport carrier (gltS) [Phaeobacter gallaeciensis]ATF02514.1 sodium--glutamate symport carrier (gltS) [Phaeobacter gallaeciensis]ATF06894.1 sodium--glutamate symport carrier (gltS) [Phaeobacter gallaeciensis]
MDAQINIPDFISLTLGFAVYLLGARLNSRVELLQRFNIPEPVSGGLLAAVVIMIVYSVSGWAITFEMAARDYLLVLFFAGIGLNARLADLVAGGRPLLLLLILTLLAILAQNAIGAAGALLFGYPLQVSVLFGSAALIGGHGTAIAWSPEVAAQTGMAGAAELGVAVATLGLVLAALVGGPIARFLINRHGLTPARPDEQPTVGLAQNDEDASTIDHLGLMRVMLHLNLAIIIGYVTSLGLDPAGVKLPLFVPCLIAGILLANLRMALLPKAPAVARTPALALVSEFSLGAFLAMSLMSLQLWTITGLGLAIAVIMLAQTAFTVAFVLFVLVPLLGRGYRAAVLAAGFGGFALGATPTAIANMTAVTKRYGPSPIAFVVLPLVSAFFVDIANAIVIQAIVNF